MSVTKIETPRAGCDDQPIVPPPSTVIVDHERKPVLYLPNGKVLIRRAGY